MIRGLIQKAIDLSEDGDIIRVNPGIYQDNLNFGKKRIIVESSQGAAETIIKAKEKMNSVVVMKAGTLRGFSITGGVGSPRKSSYGYDYYGGGVNALGDSIIENCAIYDNGKGTARKTLSVLGVESMQAVRQPRSFFAIPCFMITMLGHAVVLSCWITELRCVENCTIVANNSTAFFRASRRSRMANGGQIEIVNSILWGNSGSQIESFSSIYARGTSALVTHSLIDGGYTGQSNLLVTR